MCVFTHTPISINIVVENADNRPMRDSTPEMIYGKTFTSLYKRRLLQIMYEPLSFVTDGHFMQLAFIVAYFLRPIFPFGWAISYSPDCFRHPFRHWCILISQYRYICESPRHFCESDFTLYDVKIDTRWLILLFVRLWNIRHLPW